MPRPSPVRDAIAELVGAADRHDWSIEDLIAVLAEGGLDANFSTAFRAVERLEADGAIRRVALGDGKARYEAAGGAHHEHGRCSEGGAVAAGPGRVASAAGPAAAGGPGPAPTRPPTPF